MYQNINCRIYIVSVKADVNFVALIDVGPYDPVLFTTEPRYDGGLQGGGRWR